MIECNFDVVYLFMCHIWCVRCCHYIWVQNNWIYVFRNHKWICILNALVFMFMGVHFIKSVVLLILFSNWIYMHFYQGFLNPKIQKMTYLHFLKIFQRLKKIIIVHVSIFLKIDKSHSKIWLQGYVIRNFKYISTSSSFLYYTQQEPMTFLMQNLATLKGKVWNISCQISRL